VAGEGVWVWIPVMPVQPQGLAYTQSVWLAWGLSHPPPLLRAGLLRPLALALPLLLLQLPPLPPLLLLPSGRCRGPAAAKQLRTARRPHSSMC
jgi:hypothetical protein